MATAAEKQAVLIAISSKLDAPCSEARRAADPATEVTVTLRADEVYLLQLALDAARWHFWGDEKFSRTMLGWLDADTGHRVFRRKMLAQRAEWATADAALDSAQKQE